MPNPLQPFLLSGHKPPFVLIACALLLAGGMQTLSLAPYDFWPLAILSIPLILWATKALDTTQNTSSKQSLLYGWLFGVGLFGSGASWVYVSIHVYGYASAPLASFLTILFVCSLALFQAFSFYVYFRLRTASALFNALLFAAIWVLGDAFRTVFLTGFPWLFMGYSQLESPLSGFTPIIGVYGLSLITVLTGLALYFALGKRPKQQKGLLAIPIVMIWLVSLAIQDKSWTTPIENGARSVALIQLNIPQEIKWLPSQRKKTIALLEEITDQHLDHDIIVWPETAVPILYDQALPFLDHMDRKAAKEKVSIISGIPYRSFNDDGTQSFHNSILSMGNGEGIYHKQKLVPFGEYVPLQELLRGLIAFFDLPMSDFRKGPAEQALLSTNSESLSPFICYEVVYPDFVNSRAKDADLLLTISNDAWFGTSIGPIQHLQMAQMRAAEQGRYMIRGTNNGVTAIINDKGQITAESEQFVQTVLSSEVKVMAGRTPFSYFGSYPIFVLCGVFFLIALFQKRKDA